MNVIQDFIPQGRKNRPGLANAMMYITIHNTGNASNGAGAKSHASYIKSDGAANAPVSWHYTVDDSCVYQHLPDSETAYHAGDGNGDGNRKSIGIEICMNSDGDILKASDLAAELTANLCKRYNIPITNVKQHHNWSGKNCPQKLREGKPYNWDKFIAKVKASMEANTTQTADISGKLYRVQVGAYSVKANADAMLVKVKAAGFTDALIKIE